MPMLAVRRLASFMRLDEGASGSASASSPPSHDSEAGTGAGCDTVRRRGRAGRSLISRLAVRVWGGERDGVGSELADRAPSSASMSSGFVSSVDGSGVHDGPDASV